LAAVCGVGLIILLIVRNIVQTKTASPPFWFFIVGGLLSFVPALFFWKVQSLIIEVLSPGSSLGSAGIGAVGAEISRWLLISIVSAPVVFVVLILASLIPLSSRSGPKWGSVIASVVIELLLIAAAVGVPFLMDGPKRKNEMVDLPQNVKYADSDHEVMKDTSMVLTIGPDNKVYQRQGSASGDKVERKETLISIEDIPGQVTSALEDKTPDKRVVYLKGDVNASYGNVLQVLDAIRKAYVDRVSLVVVGEKTLDDPYQVDSLSFEVRLPEVQDKRVSVKPNPLTLAAALDGDGRVKLNNEDMGTLTDQSRLQIKLREIFKDRENNGVFREGTNEIEKAVFINAPGSAKYGDLIKMIETVKGAGGQPISVQIDNDHIDVN
jgi:biopolymer transport protein ExbD